jgi:hypothetical protein
MRLLKKKIDAPRLIAESLDLSLRCVDGLRCKGFGTLYFLFLWFLGAEMIVHLYYASIWVSLLCSRQGFHEVPPYRLG